MAGIVGALVYNARPDLASRVRLMAQCVTSTRSEVLDQHIEKDSRAVFAWTGRKATSSLKFVWNLENNIGLFLNGEVFPEPLTNSAEHLLKLYEKHGVKALEVLNCRSSGIIIDRREQTFHVFNDRFGLARIYYHESAGDFYFASEAKSLLKVLPGLRKLDQRGLAEFVSVGCVLQNRSLFAGIAILPPASVWSYGAGGRIRKQTYFDPTVWEQQEPLTAREYCAQLSETFARICSKYLLSTEPVALSLTGGLDSRMVLACVGAAPGTLPCYTFGGPYRDCADLKIARVLAKIARQPHTTLRIESDFFRRFAELARESVLTTDGAMDVSGSVELYVNQLAGAIAPVRLTGNYGSEILRSNVAFSPAKLDVSIFTPEFRVSIAEAVDTYHRERACHRLSFIAFKQVPWHHYARYAAERSQLTPRSPFLDNALVSLAYRAPRELSGSVRPLLKTISNGNRAFDRISTDRALASSPIPIYGYLENRWQEFTAKAEYAYDYGMPQWLANVDTAFKPLHLERLFLGRHKFYHFRLWYRDQLGPALRSGAFDFTRQPACYIEGAAQNIVLEHTSGRRNRTLELHKLLSVQLMDQLLTDTPCRN